MANVEFPVATPQQMLPRTTSHDILPRADPADFLPAPAADRLRKLRQRVADKHSLTPAFEVRYEAAAEKVATENRLKQLVGHRSHGGHELLDDDPRVVVERGKLAKLAAEVRRLEALDTTRSAQWREAGYALNSVETYLKNTPLSELELFEATKVPALRKGETISDAIAAREQQIAELQANVRKIEKAPFPVAHMRKQMREQVAALAARGKPDISQLKRGGDIQFAETAHRVPLVGMTEANIVCWQEPDVLALAVYINEKALVAALDAAIVAEADDDVSAMSPERKQEALAANAVETLACDRVLSELIWVAQRQGLPHEHRAGADPLAVLGLRRVARQ